MIQHYNDDNMNIEISTPVKLVYADYIYENCDFSWIDKYWGFLDDNGIFQAQTDDHTFAELKLYMDKRFGGWLNTLIYKQEWGGVPKRKFPQKHDYILIYAKGKDYEWHGDRIQIPKATAGTKLDKKGTGLKTPCSVFDDLGNFSTISKERVKKNGKNIRWQKPMKLMDRLLLPFTNEGDLVVDPFGGSFTTAVWCKNNNRNCITVELDKDVYDIGVRRLNEEI